jgi:hypothetical protein
LKNNGQHCQDAREPRRVEVLQVLETDSEGKTAEAFGIIKTCVNNIKRRKVNYLERIEHENDKLCRKVIKTSNDNNKTILNWFHKM